VTGAPAGEGPVPRSFEGLMEHQAVVVRSLAGADRSNYSGTYRPLNERDVAGRAGWTGTVHYDQRSVIDPLEEMYAQAGRKHDIDSLKDYRSAVRTVLHENAHLLSANGTSHLHGKVQVETQPETHALEEGVTELWAQRNLDEFIDRLELEEIAPGISEVEERQSYPRWTPAAAAVVQRVAESSRLHPDEVLRRMNNVHAGQKWEVAADLLYEAGELPELVPEERRSEATRNIANAMRDGYARNHPDDLGRNLSPDKYAEAGRQAVESAQDEVNLYRATYGRGDLTAGRGQDQQAGASRMNSQGRGATGLDDLDHAMALHASGAPPLTGVRRLDPSEHGSRRETASHGAQQGPRGPEWGN
jgi:hypothetical protein